MSDVRPFNARSLTLSVLLGLPEPRLSTTELMRLAELFGVAAGTQRTALSRMVAAGELRPVDGGYALHGRLLERKSAQDIGRTNPSTDWDGSWWIVAVTAPARGVTERREFRTQMVNARMGELRADTWLRPANTVAPEAPGAVVVGGPLAGADPVELTHLLWDLGHLAQRCASVTRRLEQNSARLALDGARALPAAMLVAADAVRFLRDEPYLPSRLAPPGWPVDSLRRQYRDFDRAFGRVLGDALRAPVPANAPGSAG